MKDIVVMLPQIIHYHRKQSGMTQQELARLAGVGKTVIFDAENGKATLRFTTLLKILAALNIEISLTSPVMAQWEKMHAESSRFSK